MLLWLIIGCGSGIHSQYRTRATEVLAPAEAVGEDWKPDLRLRLSKDSLHRLSQKSIASGLLNHKGKSIKLDPIIGPALELQPQLRVTQVELRSGASDCLDCLDLSLKLEGKTRWSLGKTSGKLQLSADAEARIFLELEEAEDGQWGLSLGSLELRRMKIDVGSFKGFDISPLLQKWVRKAVEAAPQISLGNLGGEDLPIHAVRISPGTDFLQIDALSRLNGAGSLPDEVGALETDWDLQISQVTLAALIRREAFEIGPMTLSMALDPQDLYLEDRDFTLNLRLWRLRWPGWWRDYQIDGSLALEKNQLQMEASEVQSLGNSRFAGLVDPLAMLAERKILRSIESGVHQAVPLPQGARFKGLELSARAEQVHAENEMLVLEGDLRFLSKKK